MRLHTKQGADDLSLGVKTVQKNVKFRFPLRPVTLPSVIFGAGAHDVTQNDQRKKEYDRSMNCLNACF